MDIIYTKEKISNAVYKLAIGAYDVRDRLIGAYYEFHVLNSRDFPVELREDWEWVIDQLTKFGPVRNRVDGKIWHGAVEHTMRRIRRSTGVKIAKKIHDIQISLKAYK